MDILWFLIWEIFKAMLPWVILYWVVSVTLVKLYQRHKAKKLARLLKADELPFKFH